MAASTASPTPATNPYLRDPDVQLMLRVKQGDEAAFAEIVARYQDRLLSILTNMVSSRETAEDLTQELFLSIYRTRHGYEPQSKFSTWVYSIAHNLACNSKRSKSRKKEVRLNPAESGPQSARSGEQVLPEKSALMPTRMADKAELLVHVREALSTLNERQRMAILLHKFEGLSYADIGASMDMSAEAVKSLLARAREQLRIALETYVKV